MEAKAQVQAAAHIEIRAAAHSQAAVGKVHHPVYICGHMDRDAIPAGKDSVSYKRSRRAQRETKR